VISYIIHTNWKKGTTVQRHNGTTAQRYIGIIAITDFMKVLYLSSIISGKFYKMKNLLVILLILISLNAGLYSQVKTYDIVSYTPPRGWTKVDKPAYRMYSIVDNVKGKYAVLAIYTAAPSSGNPQKDFTITWNTLVKQSFANIFTPIPSSAGERDGYLGLTGTSYSNSSGKQITVTLLNYTGGGQTLSILMSYSDSQYEADMKKFIGSLKLKSFVVEESKK
jgi:hypothetical protein